MQNVQQSLQVSFFIKLAKNNFCGNVTSMPRRATRGEGGAPCPFLKIEKSALSVLVLEKRP